jgi:type IX secretion system PorP/SprF family membrane protein
MKKITIITAIFGILIMGDAVAQQTPMYSQYMFNMMNINPAYTGSREVPNLTMLLRNQWSGFPGAPTSGSATYDSRVEGRNHSWGAQMYYDKIGIERTTGFQGFYSYSAPFERSTLSLGLNVGMLNYNINYNKTNPYDVGDPSLQSVINKFLPTAGLGALLSGDRWYVGLSAPALMKTKVSSDGQAVIQQAGAEGHYFLSAGYVIPVSESVVFKPSTLLKATSGAPLQADLNMNVWVNDIIGFGGSYRSSDAVVGMIELKLNPMFRLGYAYDHNISDLVNYNSGTHEFMLRYELGGKQGKKIVSPRYF